MNKREFVAGSVGAVVGAPGLAQAAASKGDNGALMRLINRKQRLPDLVDGASAATFEAYVGQRFAIVGGAGNGAHLVVQAVLRVARCKATEQFDVSFAPAAPAQALPAVDGVRVLEHATGQRLALHLERTSTGFDARFNLLT
jgi:hypothetical protein